ncbi:hypothetical protein Bca4012_058513 [Brassica carinata]|uniref:Uncharacterized protein n=1 Tax=Brassica carinata TaxID=52824 RepID=A0A8X8B582_BRACI|nr:hypothetical protein Bca52824_016248 [Brassica carinata]
MESAVLSPIGLAGLAVMSQNLTLNIAFPISVYNRTTSNVDETPDRAAIEGNLPVSSQYSPRISNARNPSSSSSKPELPLIRRSLPSPTSSSPKPIATSSPSSMSLSFSQSVVNGVGIVSWAAVDRNRPDGPKIARRWRRKSRMWCVMEAKSYRTL